MAAERTCSHEGCGTVLSKYNALPYCARHEQELWRDVILEEFLERVRGEVAEAVHAELQQERQALAPLEVDRFAGRECLSVSETADVLGVSPSTVRYWIRSGELVPLDLSGDRRLIGRDQISDLLASAARKRRHCGKA